MEATQREKLLAVDEQLCRDINKADEAGDRERLETLMERKALIETILAATSESPSAFLCSNTDEMVCPYCGHEHQDSWEADRDESEAECSMCESRFRYVRHTEVTYTTTPMAVPDAE